MAPGEHVDRANLHAAFGGAPTAVVAPSGKSANVLVFLRPSDLGKDWGVRWYGELLVVPAPAGRSSPQERAVLDHKMDGRALRLFLGLSSDVTYLGEFEVDGRSPTRPAPEAPAGHSTPRSQFVFRQRDALAPDHPLWRPSDDVVVEGVPAIVFLDPDGMAHLRPGCRLIWSAADDREISKVLTRVPTRSALPLQSCCGLCVSDRARALLQRPPNRHSERSAEVEIVLRLIPPSGTRSWTMQAALRSTTETTSVLLAHDVRVGRADLLFGDGARRRFEADLAVAADAVPVVSALVFEDDIALSGEDLRELLASGFDRLRELGFMVVLPDMARARPSLIARASTAEGATILDPSAWRDFHWQAALEGEPLTEAELRLLVEAKLPVFAIRGRWVEIWPEDVQQQLQVLAAHNGTTAQIDPRRLVAGDEATGPDGIPVSIDAPPAAWARLLDLDARAIRLELPETMRNLRPYQRNGAGWLAARESVGLGALLADEMGLGKTAQTLAAIVSDRLGAADEDAIATLVVCPLSVLKTWEDDIVKFAPSLRIHIHQGPARFHREGLKHAVDAADVVLTTYDVLVMDRAELAAVHWRRIVLDEAQYVKNPGTERSRATRSLSAERRVALTGTPIENRVRDIWSILEFLNPGLLGSRSWFEQEFAKPIEEGDTQKERQLREALSGHLVLRRLKADPAIELSLPPKIEQKSYCRLTAEQVALYQAGLEARFSAVERASRFGRYAAVGNLLMYLKQICDHPALIDNSSSAIAGRSGKLTRLEELLDEILAGPDKVLVFTQFVEMGKIIARHVRDRYSVGSDFFYGATSPTDRARMQDLLSDDETFRVLVLQLRAGGVGLNLAAANHVIHFDRWWNAAVEDQATDRAHRIGQDKTVVVSKFICLGTFEEHVDALIDRRRDLADRVIAGDLSAVLAELPLEELKRLLSIERD